MKSDFFLTNCVNLISPHILLPLYFKTNNISSSVFSGIPEVTGGFLMERIGGYKSAMELV